MPCEGLWGSVGPWCRCCIHFCPHKPDHHLFPFDDPVPHSLENFPSPFPLCLGSAPGHTALFRPAPVCVRVTKGPTGPTALSLMQGAPASLLRPVPPGSLQRRHLMDVVNCPPLPGCGWPCIRDRYSKMGVVAKKKLHLEAEG